MLQYQIALVIAPKMNIGAVLKQSLMPNMLFNTSGISTDFV